VRELRGDLRLVDEHLDERRIVVVGPEDLLDDHDALEPRRAGGHRAEHVGHPAAPEMGRELVLAEPRRSEGGQHRGRLYYGVTVFSVRNLGIDGTLVSMSQISIGAESTSPVVALKSIGPEVPSRSMAPFDKSALTPLT